ncbi:MAG: DUF885 family protein, partial [Pseudomonadota bacterium]
MQNLRRYAGALFVAILLVATSAVAQDDQSPSEALHALIDRALGIAPESRLEADYLLAAEEYKAVLADAEGIDYDALSLDDQVDLELLVAYVRTRVFEYEDLKLYRLSPVSYIALGRTSSLFLRPEANSVAAGKRAVKELNDLGTRFDEARSNLTNPARTWTENAIYTAYYGEMLLTEYVPKVSIPDEDVTRELKASAKDALKELRAYKKWLEDDLLPRSTRAPTWTLEQIDAYQVGKEMLDEYPAREMLKVAEEDAEVTRREMEELARKIHPSGDLRTVWEVMKDEAPPWDQVLTMSQSYVDLATDWLQNEGDHVVTIPDYIDYGALISPPMARRILSFGGATRGP